jgi:hypothetical protein
MPDEHQVHTEQSFAKEKINHISKKKKKKKKKE